MDESYLFKAESYVSKKTLVKLNKKHGSVTKNFVQGECSNTEKVEKANVGHFSNKQLKDKLEKIEDKTKDKKKNNINAKVGINKHNNYTPDKYAPRKTCAKCDSVNHLSTNSKSMQNSSVQMLMSVPAKPISHMLVMPNMFAQNTHA